MIFHDETDADALQAWCDARRDADLEQSQLQAAGDRIHAVRRSGRCAHQSSVAYRNPPVYDTQRGLRPGQSRCTDGCGRVFDSDQDWHDAMDDALA